MAHVEYGCVTKIILIGNLVLKNSHLKRSTTKCRVMQNPNLKSEDETVCSGHRYCPRKIALTSKTAKQIDKPLEILGNAKQKNKISNHDNNFETTTASQQQSWRDDKLRGDILIFRFGIICMSVRNIINGSLAGIFCSIEFRCKCMVVNCSSYISLPNVLFFNF